MDPNEIGRSYDALAESWQELHRQSTYGIAQFKRAIEFAKVRKHALDVGCGSSGRLVDLLLEHDFRVDGIDVSAKMISLARELKSGASYYHEDIRTWKFPVKYDFISAWDSIWHLPLGDQEPVMKRICDGLAPGGVFIFTMAGLDEPGEKSDSNMGPPVYYSTLGISSTLEFLARSGCVCRHLEYDQYPEMHVYIIAQKT